MDAWPVTRVTDVTRIPTFNDYDIKQSLLNRVVKIMIWAAMVQRIMFCAEIYTCRKMRHARHTCHLEGTTGATTDERVHRDKATAYADAGVKC
jgi:hypothetical protein